MATTLGEQDRGLDPSNPGVAFRLSQQAPTFLKNHSSSSTFPLSFAASDNADQWGTYEQFFLVSLRTGDDKTAHLCLDRLAERFGPSNERVMGLRGIYQEATAKDVASLETVLLEYDEILADNPVNVPILKRRVAILRSLSREEDAVSVLVDYLEAFPTDAEAWCELAELYQTLGLSSQATFSLEEALLITPNSWNLHARLGELQYISTNTPDSHSLDLLIRSTKHFCRSIELCDGYSRGLYGLIKATSRLLAYLTDRTSLDFGGVTREEVPSDDVLRTLNRKAKEKARELLESRPSGAHSAGQADLIALQELL